MARRVSSVDEVLANIARYASTAAANGRVKERAGYSRSWYAYRNSAGAWQFGPSKFVGYRDTTATDYLSQSGAGGERDGRQTERVLAEWFAPVEPDSRLGRELAAALRDFLAELNQVPNARSRINVLTSQADHTAVVSGQAKELLSRISSDPRICGGRPCIKGTRMRVADIVEALAHGATREELLRDFDYLTDEDLSAALIYAARASDHRVIRAA
jgi:uncharacterized protein (DUF433 family)